jgi:hypothetical protein
VLATPVGADVVAEFPAKLIFYQLPTGAESPSHGGLQRFRRVSHLASYLAHLD